MAEQWIAAATALELVTTSQDIRAGTQSIYDRANDGLLRARAVLFKGEDVRPATNVDLPPHFWWADGLEASKQNWSSGDFSSSVDGTEQRSAFGVTFALSGVLQMLPFDQRALVARRLSVAGDAAWMPARQAPIFACMAPGVMNGKSAVLEQARLGFVTGRAVLAQGYQDRHKPKLIWEEREWDVPASFWEASMLSSEVNRDWPLGRFSAENMHEAGARYLELSGVHFLIESLSMLLPRAVPTQLVENPPKETPVRTRGGGRPAQPWWDDLWCAVWGLIHQGDLQPKTQAEVEKAMLAWAALNGHEISEAVVRPKASKLFRTYKGEAANFLAK